MNQSKRLDQRFAALKAAHRTGLIPFVTAGDPAPELTVPLMHALVRAGADVIELGVPFSDPMADGPTIQHAHERSLAKGTNMHKLLDWVREFRQDDDTTPVVLMGYLNPIEIYGHAAFGRDAAAAGVDGMLVVDCPLEERDTIAPLRAAGLQEIWLCSPTTDAARTEQLCAAAEGFLYYVSVTGITGSAALTVDTLGERVSAIRRQSKAPVGVGFGVRTVEQAKAISRYADAVVIGSALVETLAGAQSADDVEQRVQAFLGPIRAGLDEQE